MHKQYLLLALLCFTPFLSTTTEPKIKKTKTEPVVEHVYDVAVILKGVPHSIGEINNSKKSSRHVCIMEWFRNNNFPTGIGSIIANMADEHDYDVANLMARLPRPVGTDIARMAEARVNKVTSRIYYYSRGGCCSGEEVFVSHVYMLPIHQSFIPQPNQTVTSFESEDKRVVIGKFYDKLAQQQKASNP